MPFAGYEDFEACVQAHSDKDNPEAYSATVKRLVEGQSEEFDRLELGAVLKTADEHSDEMLAEFLQAAIAEQEDIEQQAEGDENHVFGPAMNTDDAFYRLGPDEAYCENEGEVFDQFDEADYDDADRRCCPHCGEQLQDYDKLHNCSASSEDQQAVITGLSQEAVDAIERRHNVDVEVVDGEGSAAPTDSKSPNSDE